MPKQEPTENKWQELFHGASKVILDYMKSPDEQQLPRVKVATSVLSSFTRHEQTESAKETTGVIIARQLADNKEQFATYLRVSAPSIKVPELALKE